jgi:hypothetical protein
MERIKNPLLWKRVTPILVCCVALSALASLCLTARCGTRDASSWHPQWYSNFFVGDLEVSGQIVDGRTSPVCSVVIHSSTTPGPDKPSTPVEVFPPLKADHFSFSLTNVHSVRLTFHKDGYYPATREYYVHGRELLPEGVTRTLSYTNIHIVLRKHGELVSLANYRRFIRTYDGGPATIVDIARKPKSAFVAVDNVHAATNMPRTAVWLTADIDVFGMIVSDSNGLPLNTRICVQQKGDGFVSYSPRETNRPRVYSPFREMVEAPPSGYQRSLDLPPADRSYFFYFKIGGLYGKGSAVPVFEKERDHISTRIHLRVETNGSRNVATSN